ncbi:MAG: SDR family NAD(P)-dependent oxidoreductase [Pleurocapsa sp.]
MSNLEGKVVLVTGATRGVGKGIAMGLGESKATVYITGRSLESSGNELSGSLEETQAAIEEAGGKCIRVQVDHSKDDQVRLLFEQIESEQGRLDLLVNNVFSGVQAIRDAYGKPFWQAEPDLWDAINDVGLRSHYVASIYAARIMSKQSRGIICTISSWGGLSYIFGAAYGAGKSACDRLSSDMAVELKPDNIASISIWPGIVGTEQIIDFAADTDTSSAEGAWADGYNWETPLLAGRAIAALAQDENVMNYTGKMQVVAELAQRYNLTDKDGNRPVSLRSLRYLLPFVYSPFRKYAQLIPDLKIPWFLLLWGMLRSPKI